MLRYRCHTVQTNSRGNPGCGTPFSVSPTGPWPPPGSRPAPSWHMNGNYPSIWREKRKEKKKKRTQRALASQAGGNSQSGGRAKSGNHPRMWQQRKQSEQSLKTQTVETPTNAKLFLTSLNITFYFFSSDSLDPLKFLFILLRAGL